MIQAEFRSGDLVVVMAEESRHNGYIGVLNHVYTDMTKHKYKYEFILNRKYRPNGDLQRSEFLRCDLVRHPTDEEHELFRIGCTHVFVEPIYDVFG